MSGSCIGGLPGLYESCDVGVEVEPDDEADERVGVRRVALGDAGEGGRGEAGFAGDAAPGQAAVPALGVEEPVQLGDVEAVAGHGVVRSARAWALSWSRQDWQTSVSCPS